MTMHNRDCLVLVINLSQATKRLAHMRHTLGQIGIEFIRVHATTADDIAATKDKYYCHAPGTRELSCTEIACAVSHLRCYELLVQSKAAAALILEDDAHVSPDVAIILRHMDSFPTNWTLIHACQDTTRKDWMGSTNSPRHIVGTQRIGVALRKYTGAYGYFISKAKAQKLCQTLLPLSAPIDNTLFNQRLGSRGLYNFYCLMPKPITVSALDAQSQLHERKKKPVSLGLRIYLGIKYFIYHLTLYQYRRFVPFEAPN